MSDILIITHQTTSRYSIQ